MSRNSYQDAGVNIQEAERLIKAIAPLAKKTLTQNVLQGIGGFAGAYKLPSGYTQPVLLAATDGVGSKLKLAVQARQLGSIGIDLVAMCVNDLICQFATPLFFLDYYATGKLDHQEGTCIIEGIVQGCLQANMALIGGETAEVPGLYHDQEFDLAGFAVGIAEEAVLSRSQSIQAEDVLIALPSSGLHSNGYSLVRKLFFETLGYEFSSLVGGERLIDLLLEPTRIYVNSLVNVYEDLKGLAHITGGGVLENIPRILPEGLEAQIQTNTLVSPKIFEHLTPHLSQQELFQTFNMGIGMVLITSTAKMASVLAKVPTSYPMGVIQKGDHGVKLL